MVFKEERTGIDQIMNQSHSKDLFFVNSAECLQNVRLTL